jgi:hypothetical protein
MSEDRIADEHRGHQRPVEPRKRREPQGGAGPREGQRDADAANDDRGGNERGTGPALEEGDLGRADGTAVGWSSN